MKNKLNMPKAERTRVDYMPRTAALEALTVVQEIFPRANTQALIDRMVITGPIGAGARAVEIPKTMG